MIIDFRINYLTINYTVVERVKSTKFLGVHVTVSVPQLHLLTQETSSAPRRPTETKRGESLPLILKTFYTSTIESPLSS